MLIKLLILLLFPFSMMGQTLSGSATISASQSSGSTLYDLVSISNTGADSSTAIKTFIPLGSDKVGTNNLNSYNYYLHGPTNIPEFDTGFTTTSRIRHSVTVDNSAVGNAVYLYAAVVDKDDASNMAVFSGSEYSGVGSTSGQIATINSFSTNEVTFDLYIDNLCYAVAVSSSTNCNNFDDSVAVTGTELDLTIVIFATNDSLSRFTQVPVSTYDSSAVFYNYRLSNKIQTLSDAEVILSRLRKGDGRLVAEYSGPVISEFYDVIGYKHSGAGNGTPTDIGSLTGEVFSEGNPTNEAGEITIKGLENDLTYNISVGFVNRWKFVTKLSTSLSETPESIEVFLEKQSCYLFSAGFQEEHFILDYFRAFRDRVLLQFDLGKRFVELYYATAPQYAPFIYKSKALSFLVRTFAYGLYGLLHYFWILLAMLFVISLIKLKKLYSNPKNTYN